MILCDVTLHYRPIQMTQVTRNYVTYPDGMRMVFLRRVDDILCFHRLTGFFIIYLFFVIPLFFVEKGNSVLCFGMTNCVTIAKYVARFIESTHSLRGTVVLKLQSPKTRIELMSFFCEMTLQSMPKTIFDDKSTMVQFMAWCHHAISH